MTGSMKLTREEFVDLVAEALDSLPPDIAAAMENVEVVVEDEPPAEAVTELPHGETLLGLYHGVPLTDRGPETYSGVLPDKISIYRRPIMRLFHSSATIKEQVRKTVIHEIAHHFGIEDAYLREHGW